MSLLDDVLAQANGTRSAGSRYRLPSVAVPQKLAIAFFDLFSLVLFALLLLAALPLPAFAYVDPSVMTYTIQAVAGAAVALGAVLGVALRRTRRFLFRIFKIDENANRIVDPDVMAVEGSEEHQAEMREDADEKANSIKQTLAHGRPAKRLSWPKRFIRALICCAFLVWTALVFAPIEIVAADSGSLLFTVADVIGLILGVGLAITLASAFALSAIRGRAFDVVLTIIVACGIGCYVQALFLNTTLPVADGRFFDLADHMAITVISTIVWAAVFAALLLFNAKRKAACRTLILTVSVLLIAVQGISVAGEVSEDLAKKNENQGTIVMGDYGINEVGSKGNVTVFVLDTFETQIMDSLLENDPHILDEFTGFTYFHNSTGSLIPTRYAVPYLLTNVMPEHGESFDDYTSTIFDKGTLLADIASTGYEITLYTDSANLEKVEPYAANVSYVNHRTFDNAKLWLSIEKMALFRDMPWLLKPPFWFYTDELNANATDDAYFIDDILYGENLRNEGLRVSETADKTFRFIHLLGSHYPWFMDAEGNRVKEADTNQLIQSEGCLKLVEEYLRQLKALGLYDQSTIIVTADHGNWEHYNVPDTPLTHPASPLLLVKPPETPKEAAKPLKRSEVPTGHLDFAATVIDAVGGDSSAYGPTVFEVKKGPRERIYWETMADGHMEHQLWEYLVQGPALDIKSWHFTGETIDIYH